jgi:hypothetical protein
MIEFPLYKLGASMLGMRKHEIRRSWRSLQEVTAV